MTISYDEFEKVDFRSGTVVKAEIFPRTKKPAYKVGAGQTAVFALRQNYCYNVLRH